MTDLALEEAKKQANQKALKFVLILFVLYLLFSQGNLFMNSVFSEGGKYHQLFFANHLNYIQGLKSLLISVSTWIIQLFGLYAIHNNTDILVIDGPLLRISYSCLGLGVMSFLAAFVLAFPTLWKSKIKMLVFGLLFIFLLNVLRIAGLGLLFGYHHSQRFNFTYHHEIFNVIVYIIVFIMLYFWVKSNLKPTNSKI